MIYWLIAREVKILRGELKKDENWDIQVGLFYYRNVDDANKEDKKEEEETEAVVNNLFLTSSKF